MSKSCRHRRRAASMMLDDPQTIARKFKRAVTDSETEVRYDPPPSPASATCSRSSAPPPASRPPTLARGYTQYGPLKADAGEAVVELLEPIQARYRELLDDPGRAGVAAARRLGEGPRRRLRRRCSGPTTPSDCPGLTCSPDEPHRPAHHRARPPRARQPRGRAALRARRHGDRRSPRHRSARRAGDRRHGPRARRRRVATSSPTARPSGSPAGSAPVDRPTPPTSACRRCGCRRSSGWSSLRACSWPRRSWRAGWVPATTSSTSASPTSGSPPPACRSSSSPSAPRACSAAPPTTARRSSSCSPRTSSTPCSRSSSCSVSIWGVPGSAWSTVIGQVGAGVAFAVVVRRHLRPARHRRPSRAGMAPLLTRRPLPAAAGRLDAGGDAGATAIAGADRRADAGRPPDRCQPPPVPRPRPRRPGDPRPDVRRRGAWAGIGGRRGRARPTVRSPVDDHRRRCRGRPGRPLARPARTPSAPTAR